VEKVTKTIKIHVAWTVSDDGYVEKQAHPQQRGKNRPSRPTLRVHRIGQPLG
jgi:hypothetical protein